MTTFVFTAPDGQEYEVDGPEGATEAEAFSVLQGQIGARPAATAPKATRPPDSAGERFLRGLQQPIVGAAQAMSFPLAGLGIGINKIVPGAGDFLEGLPQEAGDLATMLRGQSEAGAPEGIDLATLAGQAVTTAPLYGLRVAQGAGKLAQAINNAAQGGIVGGLLSGTNEGDLAQNVGVGAAASAALPPVARALAKVISPATKTAAGALASRGVTLTPGMALGRAAKRVEEGLGSLPILGDVIKSSQRKSFESFNRAMINDALAPIGAKLPKDKTGREALGFMQESVSKAYDDLLPKMRIEWDGAFIKDAMTLRSMAQGLPERLQGDFNHILQKEVFAKFTDAGRMSGETMKKVEEQLGKLATAYFRKTDDAYAPQLAGGVLELRAALRNLVQRGNPQHAKELRGINLAFAKADRVNQAAARVTSEHGIFSPEAFTGAVKSGDKSRGKRAFARGAALSQDVAELARDVMGSRVPDSGTPFRIANLATGLGLSGAAPLAPGIPLAASLAAVPYLPGGRGLVHALLMQRPPGFAYGADLLERAAPALAPAAAVPAIGFSP